MAGSRVGEVQDAARETDPAPQVLRVRDLRDGRGAAGNQLIAFMPAA
jgi:hypothetical protein